MATNEATNKALREALADAIVAKERALDEVGVLREALQAAQALLRELYDGDACDCNAGPGGTHEADCFQTRIEAAL